MPAPSPSRTVLGLRPAPTPHWLLFEVGGASATSETRRFDRYWRNARVLASHKIEHISGGRFAINLVNAWNRPELERAGIGFAEHDARYAYGREWITVVDALLRGERTRFHGEHFKVDDYLLRPADPFRCRPRIYVGGESEPARQLVADKGDVWFINGQPLNDVKALIANVSERERPASHEPLRFGLSAFVIARETDEAANRHLDHLFALAAKDAPLRAQ
ncbi:MAG: alkanesulfonate monooxygenase, partial [Paraburkholderia sp.]|nr:alkanesulfonate monooxygenase [Paraburkholderia sp.]